MALVHLKPWWTLEFMGSRLYGGLWRLSLQPIPACAVQTLSTLPYAPKRSVRGSKNGVFSMPSQTIAAGNAFVCSPNYNESKYRHVGIEQDKKSMCIIDIGLNSLYLGGSRNRTREVFNGSNSSRRRQARYPKVSSGVR
jgi:hypothetical protein